MNLCDTVLEGTHSVDCSTAIPRGRSLNIPRKTSWGTPIVPPSSHLLAHISRPDLFDEVELGENERTPGSGSSNDEEQWNTLENIAALGLAFTDNEIDPKDMIMPERFSLDDIANTTNSTAQLTRKRASSKWIRSLQRRAMRRRQTVSCDAEVYDLEEELFEYPNDKRPSGHKQSSSDSSFGFVAAVKSASISLASFSVAPRSKRTVVSSRHQRTNRSSKASHGGRPSEDSSLNTRGAMIDQAVTSRLLRRRRVVEELISTEESYVADVKFLMNVYVTLLASLPSLSVHLRVSINRNLNEIVELHEELLGDLHRVVPHSEYAHNQESMSVATSNGHQRWHSLDAVPEHAGDCSWLQQVPGLIAEPSVAADVAKVFAQKMNRFFVYEEYGAKYELMIKGVASAYRTMPQWETYQKGLEALASSLASINSQQNNVKKAMTIGDLLVKPIQRVCKYPLLFSELLKQTPVCDCPDSYGEIENVLIRLREATTEINRATDDPRMKATVEKTWRLQDRLRILGLPDIQSRNTIRSLGHIHLCGALHISWQTQHSVDGQYLVCLLYRDNLLLASVSQMDQVYTVQMNIALCNVNVEEIDNGRGIQCHTAPFSWKLVFESDHQLFEITMSASSSKEEMEWRSRLVDRSSRETFSSGAQTFLTSIFLNIKPLGIVFGKPGTIARRISIHRTMTVGPTSGLCHVVIKNTNAFKESASPNSVNRSQSHLTTNRIPVIATSRHDRIRIESLLADVWTREVLPFPGMTSSVRSEQPIRATASSMMRKLSVASIASNFTRRSVSMASLHKTTEEDAKSRDNGYQAQGTLQAAPCSNSPEYFIHTAHDEISKTHFPFIHAELQNAPRNGSLEDLHNFVSITNGAPTASLRQITPETPMNSWPVEKQMITTLQQRSSSIPGISAAPFYCNGTSVGRATSLSTITTSLAANEAKENLQNFQIAQSREEMANDAGTKAIKKSRIVGISRSVVAEGLRNLLR